MSQWPATAAATAAAAAVSDQGPLRVTDWCFSHPPAICSQCMCFSFTAYRLACQRVLTNLPSASLDSTSCNDCMLTPDLVDLCDADHALQKQQSCKQVDLWLGIKCFSTCVKPGGAPGRQATCFMAPVHGVISWRFIMVYLTGWTSPAANFVSAAFV